MNKKERINTLAVHSATEAPRSLTPPKVAPIFASSVWSFESLDEVDEVWEGREPGFIYSRIANPSVAQLEEAAALLEGAEAAAAYGSGTGAIAVAFLTELHQGDHVVAHRVLYGGIYNMLRNEMPRLGVETTFVDVNDLDAVRKAMRPNTKMIYFETICNPLMEVADIAALSEIAHAAGAKVFVDNTFASPVHCRPLELGADVSIHSATKYLCGHSDVTAGVIVADKAFINRAKAMGTMYGPTLSPFDAWLILRGIRTLGLRMERHSANALDLAKYLSGHKKVIAVYYPGLEKSTTRKAAVRTLSGGAGGMLSFAVDGDLEGAKKVIAALKLAKFAPSLAGTATTTSHPGKTSHRGIPKEERLQYGVCDGLIRVSVGIEDYEDIEADFAQALATL